MNETYEGKVPKKRKNKTKLKNQFGADHPTVKTRRFFTAYSPEKAW